MSLRSHRPSTNQVFVNHVSTDAGQMDSIADCRDPETKTQSLTFEIRNQDSETEGMTEATFDVRKISGRIQASKTRLKTRGIVEMDRFAGASDIIETIFDVYKWK